MTDFALDDLQVDINIGAGAARLDIAQDGWAINIGFDGLPASPGGGGTIDGAFLVANRFSELDSPQAKAAARANLELQTIDCGVFL